MTTRTPVPDVDLSPTTSRPSPLFLPPEPSPTRTSTSATSDEPTTSETTTPPPSWDLDGEGFAGPIDPAGPSSTPSPDKAPARPKMAALRATFRQGVRTAGGIANLVIPRLVTRNPIEAEAGVWVPDADDEAAIAEPLARIASRRAPAAVDQNPDLLDAGALVLALVDYLRKSLAARAAVQADAYAAGAVGAGDDESTPPAPEESAAGSGPVPARWRGGFLPAGTNGAGDVHAGLDGMGAQ